jgi:hypothetical protein
VNFNRSQNTYLNTWLGNFTDFDIGYAKDDYVACDVDRSMFFGYNGKTTDGTGQNGAYGIFPPAQGVIILGGPFMDPDSYDNPAFRGSSLQGPSFKGNCDIVAQDGDTYGGNGHPAAGGYGPVYRFSFPGLSDTCLWGTKGITPNGPDFTMKGLFST